MTVLADMFYGIGRPTGGAMKTGTLTNVRIRGLKPGPKPYKATDGGGLYLAVTTAGGKLWRVDYKFETKRKTLSLGAWPVVSLAEAREKLLAVKKDLKAGLNPAAEKQDLKLAKKAEALTFEKAAAAFLDAKREFGFGDRAYSILSPLRKHILPALGARPIGEITAPEILDALLAIKRLRLEETAKRCRQHIGQIFRYAMVKGWAERNPAADLQYMHELARTGPVKHQRAITKPAELGRLLLSLETISHTLAGKALDLASYVFVRASELARARWDEVDLASSFWRVPAARMKMKEPHLVPLARQVKERLEALKALTGGGPCLFPAFSDLQAPMNPESLRRALNRLGYGPGALSSHTTHGFKATAGTLLRERGFDPAWIEIQLAHGERNKIVAAYNHADYIPQRQAMMQAWADYLDELREGARVEAAKEGTGPGAY